MGGYFGSGSNWLQPRPPAIRCSLLVARISSPSPLRGEGKSYPVGFEADPNASCGGNVSGRKGPPGRERQRGASLGVNFLTLC